MAAQCMPWRCIFAGVALMMLLGVLPLTSLGWSARRLQAPASTAPVVEAPVKTRTGALRAALGADNSTNATDAEGEVMTSHEAEEQVVAAQGVDDDDPSAAFPFRPVCKNRHFSGLPHSFTGVHRCSSLQAIAEEANGRCLRAAQSKWGSMSRVSLRDTAWSCSSRHWKECRVFDCRRKCRGTFRRLTCYVRVCVRF
uniref:Uncharacterized protein n=1 Tax=Alexandrium andersonii TaxID=327968 RepID=A0A7S2E085_9DINO